MKAKKNWKQRGSPEFEKQLMAYSAAAGAALFAAGNADALVHYSGVTNLPVNSQATPVLIDLNGDGTNDFQITWNFWSSTWTTTTTTTNSRKGTEEGNGVRATFTYTSSGRYISIRPLQPGNAFVPDRSLIEQPDRLAEGAMIDNNVGQWGTVAKPLMSTYDSDWSWGNFNNGANGYIGVRFNFAGGTRYGWIQFTGGNELGQLLNGTVVDWAYEDVAQRGIRAGQIRESIPTLSEWGAIFFAALLLAAGARQLRRQTTPA